MVDLGLALLVVFLVIDFAISIWNAYMSGFSLTLIAKTPGEKPPLLARAAAYAGLGLAFAGMSYVMMIVLGFAALQLGFLDGASFSLILAFDFLVFGAMIIGFGLVVTAQSVAVAYRQRSFGTVAISIWNVFAEVMDIAVYAEGFRSAYGTLKGGGSRDEANLVAVALMAIAVAFFITYAAYRHGVKRANALVSGASTRTPFDRPLPSGVSG
ncbi:MAG: hypothetical protein KGJ23_07130 [Euryarchaeota archaeon]|nr:hypothetical protein [Euryarchaeota archaeon]MDE1836372.1 hypothetical protein [Euryarchaeota archaeon]MDE1881469.1 hypothetical protein [Euryarchaeota archaeon]MDE2044232.1 hypothetical protein [Thermoplasmata archaeon]